LKAEARTRRSTKTAITKNTLFRRRAFVIADYTLSAFTDSRSFRNYCDVIYSYSIDLAIKDLQQSAGACEI
ncbi:MAG TPA: hypothetical protein VJ728_06150, partial [Candidatus Binataceae bacterium]|nr:hypothetical protein [Candidatus Binataceae bacterium]